LVLQLSCNVGVDLIAKLDEKHSFETLLINLDRFLDLFNVNNLLIEDVAAKQPFVGCNFLFFEVLDEDVVEEVDIVSKGASFGLN
jgi:hypothetical protein